VSLRAWSIAVALVATSRCEAVPSLTFEQGEGGGGDSGDAASSSDSPETDGEAGCPGEAPQNATCCGAVPCYGPYCNASNCAACAMCKATELCCSKTASNASCAPVCH
jgi:hypothetical protein